MKKFPIFIFILTLLISCKFEKPKSTIPVTKVYTESKDSLYALPKFKIDSFIDKRDHKSYHVIHIGSQVWCADNIQYKTTNKSWQYSSSNKGRLYTWAAANEACPKSFSIPSDNDWETLVKFIDSTLVNKGSRKLLDQLFDNGDKYHWGGCHGGSYQFYNTIHSNPDYALSIYLNAIGFSTYATGFRHHYLGHDGVTYFWSSTKNKKNNHGYIRFKDVSCGIPCPDGISENDTNGLRLKCIKK